MTAPADEGGLAQLARDAAARVVGSGVATFVSVRDPTHDRVEYVKVSSGAVGHFLAILSGDLARIGVPSVDVWLQRRGPASRASEPATGVVVSLPNAVNGADAAADAGLPLPTCWWSTVQGAVLVYVFTEPAEPWIAQAIVEEFSVAIPDATLSYRAFGTYCEMTTGVQVHQDGSTLDLARHVPALPQRLLDAVRLKVVTQHDGTQDVVELIPATWAGVEILRHAFDALTDANRALFMRVATHVWLRAKGFAEARREIDMLPFAERRLDRVELHKYVQLALHRIEGDDAAGAFNLYFDDVAHDVRLLAGNESYALRIKSETLFNRNHHHEFASTLANEIVWKQTFDETTKQWWVKAVAAPHRHAESLGNKILLGHVGTLSALGVPRVHSYEFAAAYVRDTWTVDAATRAVVATRAARHRTVSAEKFDTLDFFLELHRAGRIPLATEADVRRLVMALASPLLRHVAVGLLGIYWVKGPPGAGKDFLAELLPDIHRHATHGTSSPKFTLSLTNELEDKRQFYAAGPAIYGRAKEAGKRAAMAESLIRFAGTDQLPARGMRENEIRIPNTFTWLAESAEDPPNRIEISRRTVQIQCLYVDDEVSLGQVRQEILDQAPNIVADLLRKVEEKPAEWYLNQAQTKSRPVVPVALAQLFGVTLEDVEGRSLDDLFEAMFIYSSNTMHSMTEGDDQRKIASARKEKECREAWTFKSYRLSHFIDTMQMLPGYKALFLELRTAKTIELLVKREVKGYRDVVRGRTRCLEVEVRGQKYAFKLVRSSRNFILEPLVAYLTAMQSPDPDTSTPPVALAGAQAPAQTSEPTSEKAETA